MIIQEADLARAPYALYDALRAQGPLHRSEAFCGGAWLFTDYDDITAALKDPRFSVARTGRWINSSIANMHPDPAHILQAREQLQPLKRLFARALLFLDGRRHTRIRKCMLPGFKPDALAAFAPRIESIAGALLDKVLVQHTASVKSGNAGGRRVSFDFMAEFARPLPALVMADLLGITAVRYDDVVTWADDIASFIGSMMPTMQQALKAQASLVAMCDCLLPEIDRKSRAPGDDLLSMLVAARDAGNMRHDELLVQCCMLVFAGYETTRNLLGNGMHALLAHPDQWAQLKQHPVLWPEALKELLRYESPVQYTARRLLDDVVMHGQQLHKGDLVILLVGAANRDPQRFTHAGQLDIHRREGNHVSFGYGPHACIGAALTYLEAEIAFKVVARKLPDLQLVSAVAHWHDNSVYRGLQSLPLVCENLDMAGVA